MCFRAHKSGVSRPRHFSGCLRPSRVAQSLGQRVWPREAHDLARLALEEKQAGPGVDRGTRQRRPASSFCLEPGGGGSCHTRTAQPVTLQPRPAGGWEHCCMEMQPPAYNAPDGSQGLPGVVLPSPQPSFEQSIGPKAARLPPQSPRPSPCPASSFPSADEPAWDVSHAWTHTPWGLLCLGPSLSAMGSGSVPRAARGDLPVLAQSPTGGHLGVSTFWLS